MNIYPKEIVITAEDIQRIRQKDLTPLAKLFREGHKRQLVQAIYASLKKGKCDFSLAEDIMAHYLSVVFPEEEVQKPIYDKKIREGQGLSLSFFKTVLYRYTVGNRWQKLWGLGAQESYLDYLEKILSIPEEEKANPVDPDALHKKIKEVLGEDSEHWYILERFYLHGYQVKQIAEELNTSEKAILMKKKRCLERLRKSGLFGEMFNRQ